MKRRSVKSVALKIWRLGDTRLPIGRPWFRIRPMDFFAMLRPVPWQGWIVFAALMVWIAGSIGLFLFMGSEPSNVFLFGWLMPTTAIWTLVLGTKTDAQFPWDEPA